MIDREELMNSVKEDVRQGLANQLLPIRFVFEGPLIKTGGALIDVGQQFGAVQWACTGIDTRGVNSMEPTNKAITVSGLTIVDTEVEPWRFYRHIDWNSVNSQLGGSRGRATVPSLRAGV